jgi:glycolate oxidase FAD binding subunit
MITNTSHMPPETRHPESVDELVDLVRTAHDKRTALYPIGGGTSMDFGLPISRPGAGVDLTRLCHVIDYPAADMTITVEAGIRMGELNQILSGNQQQLPLDVPCADRATLGGVLATNFSGPRRTGYGTARDYVIGIRAVDGRGSRFAGGGRVVKNVAGYDFCKLLIGSMGTLGVVTEVTLKLKPRAACRQAVVTAPHNLDQLQTLLGQLVHSKTQPVAVEWLVGPDWQSLAAQQGWPAADEQVGWLLLLFEGRDAEVAWMIRQIHDEWQRDCSLGAMTLDFIQSDAGLKELSEFPSGDTVLVLKANVRPSHTVQLTSMLRRQQSGVSVQAHAASGIVIFRMAHFPEGGLAQTLISQWQPAAVKGGGNIVMLANRSGVETTRRAVWGNVSGPVELMRRIKSAFDPHDILNPDRFVY